MRVLLNSDRFLALCYRYALAVALSLSTFGAPLIVAQTPEQKPALPSLVEIATTPDHIPPKDIVPAVLGQPLEIDSRNLPLSEVLDILRQELKLTVLLDEVALQKRDVLPSDPVSLIGPFETGYALLEQLAKFKIGWYLDGNVLHLTDLDEADAHLMTVAHNIGKLLDEKFDASNLELLVRNSIGGNWEGKDGSLIRLGDVLFVRQNMTIQLRVKALLKALELPAQRVMLMQSAKNQQLRQLLTKNVSVSFASLALDKAIADISTQLDTPIALDKDSLESQRIRSNHPVSLNVQDRSARQTLQFLLTPLKLAAIIKNDQIIITSEDLAMQQAVTAVFDVRDLCRDQDETLSLQDAFKEQMNLGAIYFAKAGVVVVRETESNLDIALNMLNNYRVALKSSKPRTDDLPNDQDILTVYYCMPTEMANSVKENLATLVGAKHWQENIEASEPETGLKAGTVLQLTSAPKLLTDEDQLSDSAFVVPQSTLVITHTREIHSKIVDCLRAIHHGEDNQWQDTNFPGGGMGGGMGGGGFGGGMFQVPVGK